jgi:hypothetical protein
MLNTILSLKSVGILRAFSASARHEREMRALNDVMRSVDGETLAKANKRPPPQ